MELVTSSHLPIAKILFFIHLKTHYFESAYLKLTPVFYVSSFRQNYTEFSLLCEVSYQQINYAGAVPKAAAYNIRQPNQHGNRTWSQW